jgi:hypothetical protein
MKRPTYIAGLLCMLFAGIVVFQWNGLAAKPAEKPVELFMQQKLTHAEAVLEGLVTEDFDKIAKAAVEMRTLSQAADWQVLRTPSYDLFSKEFQRSCDQLEKAAKEENTDAASLAYIRVTMTCLSCHKHVRNERLAAVPNFSTIQTALHSPQ